MAEELLPCPFCGGMAGIRHFQPYRRNNNNCYYGYFVICLDCLTSSDNYPSAEAAVKHWNTRKEIGT